MKPFLDVGRVCSWRWSKWKRWMFCRLGVRAIIWWDVRQDVVRGEGLWWGRAWLRICGSSVMKLGWSWLVIILHTDATLFQLPTSWYRRLLCDTIYNFWNGGCIITKVIMISMLLCTKIAQKSALSQMSEVWGASTLSRKGQNALGRLPWQPVRRKISPNPPPSPFSFTSFSLKQVWQKYPQCALSKSWRGN